MSLHTSTLWLLCVYRTTLFLKRFMKGVKWRLYFLIAVIKPGGNIYSAVKSAEEIWQVKSKSKSKKTLFKVDTVSSQVWCKFLQPRGLCQYKDAIFPA